MKSNKTIPLTSCPGFSQNPSNNVYLKFLLCKFFNVLIYVEIKVTRLYAFASTEGRWK
jgi:hypothetical protein